MKELPKPRVLIRFVLVGGSTAALYYGLLYTLYEHTPLNILWASGITCIACYLYNYLMHYHWTFAVDAPHGTVLKKYVLMNLGSVLLNMAIMYVGVTLLKSHLFLVQTIAATIMISWNVVLSATWVYPQD